MSNPTIAQLIDLSGKTAIVTGGAVGIGFGIACRLAEAGAKVVIADINEQAAAQAAADPAKNGWQVLAVRADVANSDDVERLVAETVETFGSIDILVNNAGIYPPKLVMDMSEADFERVIAVNLKGVYICTKAVAQHMIRQGKGGRIINITSIDALHPSMPGLAHYDASKHGVWGFTKNVALELAPHRIWVNAIAPGAIATPGVAALQGGGGPAAAFLQKIPMQRMGEPDDIGRAALFLASDLASYMTGSHMVVDGGALLS